MVYPYQGNYPYSQKIVSDWNSSVIGVYYCGYQLQNGQLFALYVGRAVGEGGIRSRLLQHLAENKWVDVTYFGYIQCTTVQEAINLEAQEIAGLKPKYNMVGK